MYFFFLFLFSPQILTRKINFPELKYPELCSACDNQTSCQYTRTDNHGHTGALDCLTSGKGKVAYVSLAYLYQYFGVGI